MSDFSFSLPPSFSTQHPVVLFPVRVQVKFVQNQSSYELRVRIYPDQLGLSTHEEELTAAELFDGQNYWKEARLAEPRQQHSLEHWRPLVARYGSPRARWILLQTATSTLPKMAQHDSRWNRAAHSLVMPDCFSVMLYNQITDANKLPASRVLEQLFKDPDHPYNHDTISNPTSEFLEMVRTKQGKEITSWPLAVGFNPQIEEHGDEITGLDDQNLWTVNFNKALDNGMAIVVPLSEIEYNKGFKRLVVLGVKKNTPAENQGLIEQLLLDHAYTDGLELVPQGTPTNNTETGDAGFSSLETYDADASFKLLLRDTMFKPVAADQFQPDGQRFTQALGIDPKRIGPVAHASATDTSDAQRMNKALWPATYGYFMDEMLRLPQTAETLFSKNTVKKIRTYFETYVLARGPVPTFRIGNEPYGILPTTRFSTWGATDSFGQKLSDLLNQLDVTWTERLNPQPGLYPTQLNTDKDNPAGTKVTFPLAPASQQELLTALAADATSVEYYQRYLLGPVLMDTLNEHNRNLPGQNQSIWTDNQRKEGRFGTQEAPQNPLYTEFRKLLDPVNRFNLSDTWPKIFDQTFQSTLNKLAHVFADEPAERRGLGVLINKQPLSEEHGLTAYDGFDYITWLATASFDEIRLENFTRILSPGVEFTAPNSLLYRLLRQAVLLQYWEAAKDYKLLTDQESEEKELFKIVDSNDIARWQRLYQPEQGQALHEYLRTNSPVLQQYLDNLQAMHSFSTAHLERLLAEHLDLGSYRIDAWKIALATERLFHLREEEGTKLGTYLGAFAWLEDVQHTDRSVPESANERYDPDNLGYIHAPSLNHGTAAAILRQGYKSRQLTIDETDPAANRMAVDLSSKRVRKALAILEGLRLGHSLGTILGQEFERSLHQTDARVDDEKPYRSFIAKFRKAYPIIAEKALNSQKSSGYATGQVARQVVDGMALLRATPGGYPYAIHDLPAAGTEFSNYVAEQLASLTDTLDALGDLAVSEGIYQAAQGNMDRTAAILESVAKGQFPVNPEIVHPPHRGNTVTHRVLVHLPTDPTLINWPEHTPRALAEPYLNTWLAQFFPAPELVQIGYGYQKEGEWLVNSTLHLQTTGLHPIDLLILLDANALQPGSTFDLLLCHTIRINPEQVNRPADSVLIINYESSGAKSLRRLLPLMNRLRGLLAASRSALPNDLKAPGTMSATEVEHPYETVNSPKVHDRTIKALNELKQVRLALALLDKITNRTLTTDEASPVWQAVLFGVPEAIATLPAITNTAAVLLYAAVNKRITEAEDALAAANGDKYVQAAQALFGPTFRISMEFMLTGDASIRYAAATQPAATASLLRYNPEMNPLPMQEWLQGIACVRDTMDHLDKILLIHTLIADNEAPLPQLEPAQLSTSMPLNPAGNLDIGPYWLGGEWPNEYVPPGDAISLIQWLPVGYKSTDIQHALWLDEWTETLPEQEETTALTFHYDQPNTEPPQTILLVVPSQTSGWSGDDLLGAVNETLDLAKKRTVEPNSLAFTHLGTLLPAMVAPVAQQAVTFTLDFGQLNGTARFQQNPLSS